MITSEPIVNKLEGQTMPWLENESMFYMLTSDGLMICRNHQYFTSCAPARNCGPSDLGEQKPFCKMNYPRVPRVLLEQVAAFFQRMDDDWFGEAAVILLHNPQTDEMKLLIPDQECSMGSVHYTIPNNIEPGWRMIGDIHSHVRMSAFASGVDVHDEVSRPGLHIVIGEIDKEPPDFHAEVVVDGMRFKANIEDVIEDYVARTSFPEEWMQKVKKKKWEWQGWQGGKHWWKGGAHDQLAD